MKVNTWITGIHLNNYETDKPDGTRLGFNAKGLPIYMHINLEKGIKAFVNQELSKYKNPPTQLNTEEILGIAKKLYCNHLTPKAATELLVNLLLL